MSEQTKDWAALSDDEVQGSETAVAAPAPSTPPPAPAAPAKPKVTAHESRPGLVLPDPQIPAPGVFPPAPPVATTLLDEPLPVGLQDAFTLLRKLRNLLQQVNSPEQRQAVIGRIKTVSDYVNALQNEPKAPAISVNDVNLARAAHLTRAEEKRNTRLAALQAAIVAEVFTPVMPRPGIAKPLVAFLATPAGTTAVISARAALAAFEVSALNDWMFFNPNQKRAEMKIALHSNPSDEVCERIMQESLMLASSTFDLVAGNKRGRLHTLFQSTVRPKLLDLISAAQKYVAGLKAAAEESERAFFRNSGTPWQQTAVSKQFDALLAELQRAFDNADDPMKGKPPYSAIGGHGDKAVPSEVTALDTLFGLDALPAPAPAP